MSDPILAIVSAFRKMSTESDQAQQAIQTSTATLAVVTPKIAADEQWLADLTAWRAVCCDELLQMANPGRDAVTMAKKENLRLSIKTVDFGRRILEPSGRMVQSLRLGQLMVAAGYTEGPPPPNSNAVCGELAWYGSLKDVEGRLKELRARRDDAQRRLDEALHEAAV